VTLEKIFELLKINYNLGKHVVFITTYIYIHIKNWFQLGAIYFITMHKTKIRQLFDTIRRYVLSKEQH
jgi:hypothetical protein